MKQTMPAQLAQSTWLCLLVDQFLTPALDTWISSRFSTFHWICLLFILVILVSVEVPLCLVIILCSGMLSEPVFWSQIEFNSL